MIRSLEFQPDRNAPSRVPARSALVSRRLSAAILFSLLIATLGVVAAEPAVRGLPFTRRYSLEDIGYGPRGARLNFDRFGRIAVIHDGVYAVLNDSHWFNLADRDTNRITMSNVIAGRDGRMYYGARASWGWAETQSDGLLHAVPLVPADAPEWIRSASFSVLIATDDGVYFVSPNGIVFWNIHTQDTQLYEHPRIARAFRVGNAVYISAFNLELRRVDIVNRAIVSEPGTELDNVGVELATPLGEDRSLLSLLDGRLVVFDGSTLVAWDPQIQPWGSHVQDGMGGKVSVLHQLVDGRIAIGITGKGLYLFSADGELLLSLTTSDYHRITAVANREPGVLWVASEDGLEKILYSSALSVFGQKLGLTLGWPIIERWQGRLFVASDGKLYRAVDGSEGAPTHFELHSSQPENGAWALAAWGPHLLVAGPNRVYSAGPEGDLQPIAEVSDLAHLVMINAAQCYAIGRSEIALLEWREGKWTERVERTRGVTYPSVVHRVKNSVWIEMGGQVGRLWLDQGELKLESIPNSTWTKRPWVNIGVVDGTVVLSAEPGERRFFDEERGAWTEEPELHQLLERSPYWIARVEKDESGTIWGTHDDGVIRFKPAEQDYEIDTKSFDLINDRYPVLQVLPGSDVWIIAGQSLYHVERRWTAQPKRMPKPILVSVVDFQGVELLTSQPASSAKFRLPFERNSLTFQFFAGSDAVRRAPTYEYKLTEQDPWTAIAGSQVSFRGLREGKYNLQARLAEKYNPAAPVATFPFEIAAPWYRTLPAYLGFGLIGAVALLGVMRWASYVERKRNRVLEQVVQERTHQLQETMAKLGEETRNAATLAERDRLANEIHDSVQQGLTGAILQLDTTLKSPAVSNELRPRLNVVRNMVSYARQEVQHAVWDMESPLLEGSELASALRNLTTFVDSGETKIEVSVAGAPIPLGRTINHNLLRVAQEATTNAIRHAQAQRVTIHLVFEPDTVALTISDDGIGFVPDAVLLDKVGHLGLRGIRNRVRKLRGQLKVESAPNQGTSIRIVVPKPHDENPATSA